MRRKLLVRLRLCIECHNHTQSVDGGVDGRRSRYRMPPRFADGSRNSADKPLISQRNRLPYRVLAGTGKAVGVARHEQLFQPVAQTAAR
jgi:hypothetical protein